MKYRHFFIISSLLFCGASATQAQYNTLNEWYLGINGGASASTVTLAPKYVGKMYNVGKTAGLTLRYVSEKHYGLQIECNYLESGWLEDYSGQKKASNYSYARNLRFVEVPFLMHAYTRAGSVRFFANAGPRFAYLLSEDEEVRTTAAMLQHGKEVQRPFQYGLLGGGGLELDLGKTAVGLEGRYCYDLSNLFNDAVGQDFVTSDLQIVTVKMYLLFRIK